ncbi:hypothetical protein EXIGLDRAFT_82609 [Exidia glandulosa HHB12029]|uniref:SUR7-domain-containing protein n=1 Tax=Exidia glandulosa HHB12029 TaxID=1314781 RepID=A0A165HKQ3_EXIGL|nr:hypothetical protein EXIGLDRAFT_82609 [Exidia glandulosa HHB12029]
MHIRGEVCVGAGTLLAMASVVLLIFTHIGQINTSTVPRGLAMVSVDVSGYGLGLESATGDQTPGLYNTTADAPLGERLGLRQTYKWGLYSYCGYVNAREGTCSNTTIANRFRPLDAIINDTPQLFSVQTRFLLAPLNSTNGSILSLAAYYLLLIGSIFTFLAMLFGIVKASLTFFFAAGCALLGSICLIVSAAIWTALIRKAQGINDQQVALGPSLGIHVDFDTGLWLLWASAAAMFVSILPYLVSCCTFRR